MFTAFLASLACLTLRSDSLAALAAATATPTPCDACDGHGEHGHGPDAVECRACGCTGERLVSAWDEDRDSARRRVLAATLVPCDRAALPAARSHAAALRASLQMTARRTLTHRVCPCCAELRDARSFEGDGVCELCHIDLDGIAAAQHEAALASIEAELDAWPVVPPAMPWQGDADGASMLCAEVA